MESSPIHFKFLNPLGEVNFGGGDYISCNLRLH